MSSETTAVLIDSDPGSARQINDILKGVAGEVRVVAVASELKAGFPMIQSEKPSIILLEVKDLERGAREVEFLLSHCGESSIFVSCDGNNPERILKLIRAGAAEYLPRPVNPTELSDAVRKVMRLKSGRRGEGRSNGMLICTYHPTGGCGSTTMAVNLAAAYAMKGECTALLDLDRCSCEASAFLDLAPRYTFADLVQRGGTIDSTLLKSLTVAHGCGVSFLDGPACTEDWQGVTPELIKQVCSVLRGTFSQTVIDSGGPLDHRCQALFHSSDFVLYPLVLSLPALRTARRTLRALQEHCKGGAVRVVVNRYVPRDEIGIGDAEKVLGLKVYQTLPNSYRDLKEALDKGVPLASFRPHVPYAKSISDLARRLSEEKRPSEPAAAS